MGITPNMDAVMLISSYVIQQKLFHFLMSKYFYFYSDIFTATLRGLYYFTYTSAIKMVQFFMVARHLKIVPIELVPHTSPFKFQVLTSLVSLFLWNKEFYHA